MAIIVAAAIPATLSAQQSPTFYGVTLNQDIYTLVSFEAGENVEFNEIFYDDDLWATGGLFYAEGKIYSNWLEYNPYGSIDKVTQYVFDAKTGSRIETREMPSEASGFAINYDETEDRVYGYFSDPMYTTEGGYYAFSRIDLLDVWPYMLGTTVSVYSPVVAIAINPEGECYGIDYLGQLVKVDKGTGRPTTIGETGMVPDDVPQSVCFDPTTGKFYWAAVPTEGTTGVYEVDLNTGAATLVASYEVEDGEGMQGLYIPYPEPTAASPTEVDDIVLDFPTTSLTGTVTFTAPSTTVGGDAITTPYEAYVFLGTETRQLEVMPGQQYSVEMTVDANKMYNCRVWTILDGSRSAKHTVAKWIGADYPKAPTNLQVFEENGNVVFTWDTPPATGIHDGYVNPDEITYIIARGTDLHITDYVGNRFEEPLPEDLGSFQYYIRSSYQGLNGDYAYSDNVTFGDAYDVPLEVSFLTAFDQMTIIDANADGNTWQAGWSSAVYKTGNSGAGDDWMITPKINLKAGKTYVLTIEATADKFFMDEEFEVYLGQGFTVDAMTQHLADITVSKIDAEDTYEVTFTCPEDGQYNLGFHYNGSGGYNLNVYGFSLVESASTSVTEVRVVGHDDNNYYDLTGCKVAAPQRGGIYIHQGKKVRF